VRAALTACRFPHVDCPRRPPTAAAVRVGVARRDGGGRLANGVAVVLTTPAVGDLSAGCRHFERRRRPVPPATGRRLWVGRDAAGPPDDLPISTLLAPADGACTLLAVE